MHLLCLGAMPPLCSVCLIHGTDDTTMFEKLPICSDCTQHINTYLFTPNIIKKNGNPVQFDVCPNCIRYADNMLPLCLNCWRQMSPYMSVPNPNRPCWQNLLFSEVYSMLEHIKDRIRNDDKNIVPIILMSDY